MPLAIPKNIHGLSNEQVLASRELHGSNQLVFEKKNEFLAVIIRVGKDPMVILLFVASLIYFVSGKTGDGIFLASAIIFQSGISMFQYTRSRNALENLKEFIVSHCKVIRDSNIEIINSNDLVLGDCLLVEEGTLVPADGFIIHSNDFSLNESILTGESLAVFKDKSTQQNQVFRGTTVSSGLAIVTITAIGNQTKLGKIGKSIEGIDEEKTPLELQIANFVKKMAYLGGVIFVIVWLFNYWHSKHFLNSLLQSLTLAMSILPEEIPVAFTTFMALGAWRLMKMGIVVKQMKTVETLGSSTVICIDKTGTLTENIMDLAKVYNFETDQVFIPKDKLSDSDKNLITLAMFASEPMPFDPMEIALHKSYSNFIQIDKRPFFSLIHEYPLGGKPPMMTHIFRDKKGETIIAAKGAPEALIRHSNLENLQIQKLEGIIKSFADEGYRVLAVANATFETDDFPKTQQEFKFSFKGIVAFYDPPKANIEYVLKNFYHAGINVKIITGDNAATTISIAKQIGFKDYQKQIDANDLMKLTDDELQKCVSETQVFTRMFPEAKLRVINALKANNEIVAMTGDGVNDGPALKASHIGIAMGKKGTEIAKQAASLILLKDNLAKMVQAVSMGRKIYSNLKKAIQYIISIHIPIILTVFVPLALGWIYPNIFSPIHIIFLELIMGPTCSIIYENEPLEKNIMSQKPRPFTDTFFSWRELTTSIIQGLVITLGTMSIYQFSVINGYTEALTRTMVFTTLITANIMLTMVNRSFYYSMFTTMRYKNNLVVLIAMITIFLTSLMLFIKPINQFFEFTDLTISNLGICLGVGVASVLWFEGIKWIKRFKNKA
ncbi:MAG: cation-translocating P-type ATPase [Spirosomataceae bacterium]